MSRYCDSDDYDYEPWMEGQRFRDLLTAEAECIKLVEQAAAAQHS